MTLIRTIITQGFGTVGGLAADTPALEIVDNEDGTGAVATITASTPGATNIVYTAVWDGLIGAPTWTASGSRTGDGTVSLALARGNYWAYVKSVLSPDSVVSNLVRFDVTDAALDAVLYGILTSARDKIVSLALPACSGGSPTVTIRKLAVDRNIGIDKAIELPAILLVPNKEAMPPAAGVIGLDDVIYGVWCVILIADDQEKTLVRDLDIVAIWRQTIARAIRHKRLAGVAESIFAYVEPQEVTITGAWSSQLFASALLLQFVCREPTDN